MPARTSGEKGVCLSVKRVDYDKTEEDIFIPYETVRAKMSIAINH